MSLKNYLLIFFVLALITLPLFYSSLSYFFLQDDWLHINISGARNIEEFLQLFAFRTDIIGWRPISKQLYFLGVDKIFNLNPYPAHIIVFSFHLANGFLLFFLTRTLFKNTLAAILASYFYLTASFHFMALSWLSAGENIIGAFFYLLSTLLFVFYKYKRQFRYYLLSLATFLICLASTEFALTWPIFIFILDIFMKFKNKPNIQRTLPVLLILAPQALIVVAYLLLRIFVFPLPAKETYQLGFDLKVIKSLFWYVLWFLNVPEVVKYHFSLSTASFFPDQTFWNPFKEYIFPLLGSSLVFLSLLLYLVLKKFNKDFFLKIIIAFVVFIISLLPVVFLPAHTFPYYLTIPALSLCVLLGSFLSSVLREKSLLNFFLVTIIVFGWYIASFTNLAFTRRTHWIGAEETISESFTAQITDLYTKIPQNSIAVIFPVNAQLKQSLMDQNALKAIYRDKSLGTVYTDSVKEIKSGQKNLFFLNFKLNQ